MPFIAVLPVETEDGPALSWTKFNDADLPSITGAPCSAAPDRDHAFVETGRLVADVERGG